MIRITDIVINSTHVIVVSSVLNQLHILVSLWDTELSKLVSDLGLDISSHVLDEVVSGVELLSEVLLSLLSIDLSKLLHLKGALSDSVLLLLSEITEVASRRTSPHLA